MRLNKISPLLFAAATIGLAATATFARAASGGTVGAASSPVAIGTPSPGMIFSTTFQDVPITSCNIDSPSVTVYKKSGSAVLMAIFSLNSSNPVTAWDIQVAFYDENTNPIGKPIDFKGSNVHITSAYSVLYDMKLSAALMNTLPAKASITHATCS
jgi:hypothetical protein